MLGVDDRLVESALTKPDDEEEHPEEPQQPQPQHPQHTYEIPAFWDILLETDRRIVHQPPPLQWHETQQDRDHVDWLLKRFWDPADSRALRNHYEDLAAKEHDVITEDDEDENEEDEKGKEFTYGEVTPTGVRQLLEDMELLQINGMDGKDDSNTPIVFYDLGSGEGKLLAQVLLERLLLSRDSRAIGIELHPARHAMAVKSWEKAHQYLMNDNHLEEPISDCEDTQAKAKLQEKYLAAFLQQPKDDNTSKLQLLKLVQGDLLECDFSDATHIFASSIFFPKFVLKELCGKISHYAMRPTSKLCVVAALSDLPWLEDGHDPENDHEDEELEKAWGNGCCPWEKRMQRLQMTWGGANVRLYFRKDY